MSYDPGINAIFLSGVGNISIDAQAGTVSVPYHYLTGWYGIAGPNVWTQAPRVPPWRYGSLNPTYTATATSTASEIQQGIIEQIIQNEKLQSGSVFLDAQLSVIFTVP